MTDPGMSQFRKHYKKGEILIQEGEKG